MYATRLKVLVVILAVGIVAVLGSLVNLQVIEGARYRREAQERLRRPPGFHPTLRGTIYDRKGVVLAQDTGAHDVAVYFPFIENAPGSDVEMTDEFVRKIARQRRESPEEVRERVGRMWPELARLTGVPIEEIERRKQVLRQRVDVIRQSVEDLHGRSVRVREETYGDRTSVAHPIVYDIDLATVGAIASRPDDFPGLVALPTRKREYPYANIAPHVVGMLGEISRDELDGDLNEPYPRGDLRRYWPGDFMGRGGVEQACETLLRGTRGMYRKGIEGDLLEDIDPVPGQDVHLTLDIALQADIEDVMDRADAGKPIVGAAVVLDCRTGEVLALASAPRYDIGTYTEDFPSLLQDPRRPLLHRAVAGLYPMGSTFKVIAATAALHEGAITPRTFLTCDGILDPAHPNRFRCHIYPAGHGTIPLRLAIQKSCNVFFYHVAELLSRDEAGRISLAQGSDRLEHWARVMGLGRPAGLALPGEAGGRIVDPADPPEPRNLVIGQGKLVVTPLQAAQVYGLVATAGRMPRLRLIRELAPPPAEDRRDLGLNGQMMATIMDGLSAVVNEPGGTGYAYASLPDIRIFGKTGTAQAGRGEDHAWFDGGATVENPRYIFSIIYEHGGHGGTAAGPIAREIVRALQAHGYFEEFPPDAAPAGKRPAPPLPFPPVQGPGDAPPKTIVPVG